MLSLFPIYPEGFSYQPDFISKAEETRLVEHLSGIHLHNFNFQGYEARREVASFGYDWNFEKRSLTKGLDIPLEFAPLMARVANYLQLRADDIQELLVTRYPEGSVINWHRDAPAFDLIAGLSLLSDCTFRFRPYDPSKQGRKPIVSLTVARRSLYVMQRAARSDFQHSILPIKSLRYSITFRTLKQEYGRQVSDQIF